MMMGMELRRRRSRRRSKPLHGPRLASSSARLAIALVIAVAVPLSAAGYFFTTRAESEAIDAAEQEQETLAGSLAAEVDAFLDLNQQAAVALAGAIQSTRGSPAALSEIQDH